MTVLSEVQEEAQLVEAKTGTRSEAKWKSTGQKQFNRFLSRLPATSLDAIRETNRNGWTDVLNILASIDLETELCCDKRLLFRKELT